MNTLNSKDRITLCKCRYKTHKRSVNRGSFEGIARFDRLRTLSDSDDVADESHHLFKCTDNELVVKRSNLLASNYRMDIKATVVQQKRQERIAVLASLAEAIMAKF